MIKQGMQIDPSEEELFTEYWQYSTKRVKEIYDRFNQLQHKASVALKDGIMVAEDRVRLEKINVQAKKRCKVATLVIGARFQDNHEKPPTQFIRPEPLSVGVGIEE